MIFLIYENKYKGIKGGLTMLSKIKYICTEEDQEYRNKMIRDFLGNEVLGLGALSIAILYPYIILKAHEHIEERKENQHQDNVEILCEGQSHTIKSICNQYRLCIK